MNSNHLQSLELSRRALLAATGVAGLQLAFGRMLATPAQAAGSKELQIMAWEGYDLTNELADWRQKNGVSVQTISIATQDDVQAKFIAGNPPPIDLAEYNQAYSKLYINDLKIVKPLDVAQIPNYSAENLWGVLYQKPSWYSEGQYWGAPYSWGFNTILYNPDAISEPKSYADLLDPKLKGKLAIMDDTVSTWPVAARVAGLGAKYPNLTKDELKTAFTELAKYRDQARLIVLNQGDLANFMGSGEIDAALCADPSIFTQVRSLGKQIEMAYPKEGVVLWVDSWFIPVSADNVELAHEFINLALDPEIQAKVATAVNQCPTSQKAVAHLSPEALKRVDYSKVDELFAVGLPGIPPLKAEEGHANYEDWVDAWQEFKAGM